ncbi:MAG TPA: hypothetical protein VGM50_22235 [Gemmatimonadaceae bacterium]
MRTGSFAVACVLAFGSQIAPAQTIPVATLSPPSATSTERFGTILNVRELPGRRLLVNDGKNRLVKLLTSTLATERIVLDSALESANTYGNFPLPLIPYLGDSTLFASPNKSRAVFVIDPNGNVTRNIAMPNPGDVALLRRAMVDNQGRIIFAARAPVVRRPAFGVPPALSDSTPLVRADLAARRNDTIAYIARPFVRIDTWNPRGNQLTFWQADPLRTLDEWTVLTDGSLALVRGHDYHVDWLRANGAKASTPKMPFEWKQLSDAEKTMLADSIQAHWRSAAEANALVVSAEHPPTPWPRTVLSGSDDPAAPTHPSFDTTKAIYTDALLSGRVLARLPDRPTVDQVYDYYAPMRDHAVMADRENRLWILPTLSKESKAGELVYDVVSSSGTLIEHVRMPLGRYIVGFGKNDAVYLAVGDMRSGFAIERATVVESGPR